LTKQSRGSNGLQREKKRAGNFLRALDVGGKKRGGKITTWFGSEKEFRKCKSIVSKGRTLRGVDHGGGNIEKKGTEQNQQGGFSDNQIQKKDVKSVKD